MKTGGFTDVYCSFAVVKTAPVAKVGNSSERKLNLAILRIRKLAGPICQTSDKHEQRSRQLLRRCVHCAQVDDKFAYENSEMRTNEIEKWMAHFKSTFTTITQCTEILKRSQTMRALLSQYSCGLPWSFASCVVCHVLKPIPAFWVRCTHHFHDYACS